MQILTLPGRATTPTFVDIREKKAVNNDYHRLTNYIEVQFRKFQPVDAPDLYPVKYRKEIDEFNDWLFPTVNNGHYRMAFCQSWEAYDEAYNDFFDSVEKLDERLKTNRFLFGDYITDSDIRLYVTLVRWETSYYHNVGPMKKRITEYENLWGYVKELSSFWYSRSTPSLNFQRMMLRGFSQATRNGLQHRYLMIPSGKQMEGEKHFLQIPSMYSRSIRKGKCRGLSERDFHYQVEFQKVG
ncbi:MAG: glutathione S-transferase C-terminal domain-containing protein [Blautia sp.]